jgi:hypothetical protein
VGGAALTRCVVTCPGCATPRRLAQLPGTCCLAGRISSKSAALAPASSTWRLRPGSIAVDKPFEAPRRNLAALAA